MTSAPVVADDEFPVEWPDPADAGRLWNQDRLHYPDPLSPLEFSLIEDGVDAGLTKAAHAYGLALTVHDRHVNTFLYTHIESGPVNGDGATSGAKSSTALEDTMTALRETWDATWLPEIQEHLEWWSTAETSSFCAPGLLNHLDETVRRWQRVWEIHFLMFIPAKLAISEFADLYADLFGDEDQFNPYRMITGGETKSAESGQWLWTMSRRILAMPGATKVLREHPVDDVVARLSETHEGSAVVRELDRYLAVHGRRADKLTLRDRYWVEDPGPVIQSLQQYLFQTDRDLAAELAETRRQRDACVGDLRARLVDYPRAVRDEVLARLTAAQEGAYLSEEHGYWIDFGASYWMRQVLLVIGAQLAADAVLADSGDVFYLHLDELRRLMASGDPRGLYIVDLEGAVAERRAAGSRFATVVPPFALGAVAESSGDEPADRVSEMFHKVEGKPAAVGEDGVILGTGSSPGVVRGTVKVILSLHGAAQLLPGDVLVAEATSPPWTLLFATAGALVTNSGGILSHAAVIAREYGIPAVLGTGDATRRLRDGQRIEVDGTRGIVRILD